MTPTALCRRLERQLPGLFETELMPDGALAVTTPLLLPDNDLIDVYVTMRDGCAVVSDCGETLGWLRRMSPLEQLPVEQSLMIEEICLSLGVNLQRHTLSRVCESDGDLAESILLVAQAAVRVGATREAFPPYRPTPGQRPA